MLYAISGGISNKYDGIQYHTPQEAAEWCCIFHRSFVLFVLFFCPIERPRPPMINILS
jgi:hypothetical protein